MVTGENNHYTNDIQEALFENQETKCGKSQSLIYKFCFKTNCMKIYCIEHRNQWDTDPKHDPHNN